MQMRNLNKLIQHKFKAKHSFEYYCQTSDKSETSLEKNRDLKYRKTIIKNYSM